MKGLDDETGDGERNRPKPATAETGTRNRRQYQITPFVLQPWQTGVRRDVFLERKRDRNASPSPPLGMRPAVGRRKRLPHKEHGGREVDADGKTVGVTFAKRNAPRT
jgi:hypothetical protein